MPVIGGEFVAKNLLKAQEGFIKLANRTMVEVKDILDQQVAMNISLKDHTQAELTAMGHPYAARHGDQGSSIHEPYWLVHSQSGALLSSKQAGTVPAEITGGNLKATAFVGLDQSMAPHALFVVFGTSKMIPRPVLKGSRDQIKDQAYDLIKNNFKNLKFNFGE